jgi:GH43 family beta-xylosidase
MESKIMRLPKKLIRPSFILGTLALGVAPLLLSGCSSTGNSEPATLRNPIAEVADPFIRYHQGQYYLTGTRTGGTLEMQHAPHLGELGKSEAIEIWAPGAGEPAFQVWSPSMFLLNYQGADYWFIYFTAALDNNNESHRIYVLQSTGTDPLGPYTFKGQLDGTDGTTAIDASLLEINQQLYLIYVLEKGTNATYVAPMSDALTVSGAPNLLIDPDQSWERGGDTGKSTYPVAEGPTALYHDGKSFIVYSGSDTGNYNYCLGLLTYDGKGDPLRKTSWTKSGPVFQYSEANGVYGPGRATFTLSPDGKESWMVYHAKDTKDFTYEGRITRAQKFSWKPDGTPDFGTPVSTQTEIQAPSGE